MKIFTYLIALFLVAGLLSCSKKDNPVQSNNSDTSSTLSAFKLASDADAPDYNSQAVESIWNSATPISVSAMPIGSNFTGSNTPISVTMKSVVSSQNIYFLVQYDDPTEDHLRQPLHFHGGDPTSPSNWTVDKNTYDDGFSMIFEILPGTTGSKTFATDGCTMLCHSSSKNFGGGLIADPGLYSESLGRYDLWYWHAGKSNGCGYADDDVSIGIPNYQIKHDDDNNTEIYLNNVIDDNPGAEPYVVAGGTNRNLDPKYFIADESSQSFSGGVSVNPATKKAWAADDIVPSYELAQPADPRNDYFDVHAKGYYSGGKWVVKFQRKLDTGNPDNDAIFSSGNEYLFSFAIHQSNAPDNHYGSANKSFKLKLP